MINKKQKTCQKCKNTEFIEFKTGYKCKNCGDNSGKNAFKNWIGWEFNNWFNKEGRLRKGKANLTSSTRRNFEYVKIINRSMKKSFTEKIHKNGMETRTC